MDCAKLSLKRPSGPHKMQLDLLENPIIGDVFNFYSMVLCLRSISISSSLILSLNLGAPEITTFEAFMLLSI